MPTCLSVTTRSCQPPTAASTSGKEEPSLVPGKHTVKIILLGDSAVGKSKLVERFLMDGYKPHTLST